MCIKAVDPPRRYTGGIQVRLTRDRAMSAIIDTLRRDHRNFDELLRVLEQEMAVFDRTERPDYELLEAIVGYFEDYSDRCHHPREDAVFEKLKERDPAAAAAVGDLEAEHVEVAKGLRRFASVVEAILVERDIPREDFDKVVRDFIDNERRHMKMEEETFFPAALEALTAADLTELDGRLTDEKDPLFAGEPEQRFAALRRRIVQWEKDDQAERRGDD
jgi:hemerythrin-like domain-containing protein